MVYKLYSQHSLLLQFPTKGAKPINIKNLLGLRHIYLNVVEWEKEREKQKRGDREDKIKMINVKCFRENGWGKEHKNDTRKQLDKYIPL